MVAILLASVDVGGGLDVGILEHDHHRHENSINSEDGPPPDIGCLLQVKLVCAWRVQNRDANLAIGVDVRVPHLRLEDHFWGVVRVVIREPESRFEVPTLVMAIFKLKSL